MLQACTSSSTYALAMAAPAATPGRAGSWPHPDSGTCTAASPEPPAGTPCVPRCPPASLEQRCTSCRRPRTDL